MSVAGVKRGENCYISREETFQKYGDKNMTEVFIHNILLFILVLLTNDQILIEFVI